MPHSNETQWARASKIQRLLVPKIDTRLKTDGDTPFRKLLEQFAHLFADPEDFIDKIDVIDAATDKLIDLCEYLDKLPFAIFVSEQCLVAERAGVRTAPSKLHLCSQLEMVRTIAGKDVMQVTMPFGQGSPCNREQSQPACQRRPAPSIREKAPVALSRQQQPATISHGKLASWGRVWSGSPRKTTSAPVFSRVARGVTDPVRTDCHDSAFAFQCGDPLARHTKLRLGATPEQI